MVSVDTLPDSRISGAAGDRKSRLAAVLAEVGEILEAMPTGLSDARPFVSSRLWHSPRPEEMQTLVGMAGRSGAGSRRESAGRLIALRLLADREVKSFWNNSVDDPYGILGQADVLRWILDEIREEQERLEGAWTELQGADRGDREFRAQVAKTLSPNTDVLIAAMVIAPSLARLAQPDLEADRRAVFPALSDREAEILRPAAEGGPGAPSTLRLAALEVAAARWTFLEELRAWEALTPPARSGETEQSEQDEQAERPLEGEEVEVTDAAVPSGRLVDEAPAPVGALEPTEGWGRSFDTRMIPAPSGEPASDFEHAIHTNVPTAQASPPSSEAESELDRVSIPDLSDDAAAPTHDFDDGARGGDDERARLRLRFREQHELVFRVVGERLQSRQNTARATRDKELIEPLIVLRQGLVASFRQLAASAEGRSSGDGRDEGGGSSDTSKDAAGSSTQEEQALAEIFGSADQSSSSKGETAPPTLLAQHKARKRRRVFGMVFAAMVVIGIAEAVKLSLPPPGPPPIEFSISDSIGVIHLDSAESIGNLLYAHVPESWLSLPSDERSRQIEALGRIAKARGFGAVYLVDPGGEPAGKWVSTRGVTFLSSPSRSSTPRS